MSYLIPDAIADVKLSEGFRSEIYNCPAGFPTWGYGSRVDLGITEEEASAILEIKMLNMWNQIVSAKPWAEILPLEVRQALQNLVYNVGPTGCLGFRRMWAALETQMWGAAAAEVMDSTYARQVGDRAKRVANLIGGCDPDFEPLTLVYG